MAVKPKEAPEVDAMAQAQAIIDQMIADAQKKVDEMLANAEARTKGSTVLSEESKAMNAANEEYVTVKLFKDSGKYADDVFVAVNGEGCSIPRGQYVEIKKKFANVLDQSDLQDIKTAEFMEAEADKFAQQSKALNI